jgi:ketosteroid isomerase-like protein
MPTNVSRDLIESYFRACVSRDPARVAPFLHDDVEWSCAGPVDLLHFCGTRRAKSTVLDIIVRLAPSVIRVKQMDLEEILVDGDRAATFMQLTATHVASNRTLSYRCAQFLRFHEGKLIEFRALIDSFDAAEQMLGHSIALPKTRAAHSANVIAI